MLEVIKEPWKYIGIDLGNDTGMPADTVFLWRRIPNAGVLVRLARRFLIASAAALMQTKPSKIAGLG
ncbi:MAG: hypothetical protein ACKN9T_15305 [Candidatus Methylumidiphilus sp.]